MSLRDGSDTGILDNALAMVALRYICDSGGQATAESVRDRCREVLGRIGWDRRTVDSECVTQVRRMLRVGYIGYRKGKRVVRVAPRSGPLVYVITNLGRNGVSCGVPSGARRTRTAAYAATGPRTVPSRV